MAERQKKSESDEPITALHFRTKFDPELQRENNSEMQIVILRGLGAHLSVLKCFDFGLGLGHGGLAGRYFRCHAGHVSCRHMHTPLHPRVFQFPITGVARK